MSATFKRLEIRHLRLVQALANADGMSAAAKHLHLSQSALSHQLKVLEDTLACQLFLRHGKKLIMTAAGKRVLKSANDVLGELETMRDDLLKIDKGQNVSINIATECITSFQWLPKVIPTFKKRYPEVDINLNSQARSNVTELLEEGEIDIAIKMVPAKKPYENHPLFTDQLVVVMAKDHELAGQDLISPDQIAKENLLLCPNAKEKLFRGLALHVDTQAIKTTEFPLTEAIMEWCDAGMGISVIADWAASAWKKQNLIQKPLDVPWAKRKWTAVTLPQDLPDYMKDFIGLIQR